MTKQLPEAWYELLRRSELFGHLPEPVLLHLGASFEEQEFAAGADVVKEGDEADSLFVVLEGKLDIVLDGDDGPTLRELRPGNIIGEVALLVGGKRSATARATETTRVLRLSRESLDALVDQHPELMAPLTQALSERMRRGKIAKVLRALIGRFDAEALADVERLLTWVHLPSGHELFHQGDAADGAYIVVTGRVRIAVSDGETERIIDDSGPGEWIGEMALLTRSERSATVYAVRDSELLWLPTAVFDSVVTRHPLAMLGTSRLIVTRLQRHLSGAVRTRPQTKTLAIVPVNSGVAVDEFCDTVVAALREYGSVLHLTAPIVDQQLGKKNIARVASDDPAQLRLAPWLIEQEDAYRFVVYQGDKSWSAWTDRSIRHADHVLLVADGRAKPDHLDAELTSHFSGGRAPKRSLVLLQPAHRDTFPDTARWLDIQKPDDHHHVRQGSKGDIARLVRILTGNAVCLVLGGGGSRGYAHLGVLRAFEELGIPVDAVAGTSIGAVVALGTALGVSWRDQATRLPPLFTRCFGDVTLPLVALLSGAEVMDVLAEVGGTACIEDLATPFFCVSTNLTRGGQVVHRRGSAALGVRASTAIPGVFPPVPWSDDLLVDGGLSNNVPVDTMASLFGGVIVAVDVMPDVDLRANGPLPTSVSGWSMARKRLNPFAERSGMPDILSVLVRSVTIASQSLEKAEESTRLSSLYLRPAVNKWNIVDFKNAAPLIDQGYEGTIKDIQGWWAREKSRVLGGSHGP